MGGLQVIFTGDFFQLPPVSTAKVGSTMIDFKNASSGGHTQHHTVQRVALSQSSTATTSSSVASQLQYGTSTSSNTAGHSAPPRYSDLSQLCQAVSQPIKSSQCRLPARPNTVSKDTSTDTRNARFCFQSPVWSEVIGKNTFVLTNIFRQKDAEFAAMLNSIRCGELTGNCTAALDIFLWYINSNSDFWSFFLWIECRLVVICHHV